MNKVFGVLVASAVTGLLATGTAMAEEKAAAGKCVHSCKGHGSCKGEGNDYCKGKNACAGQGKSPKECATKKKQDACEGVKGKDGNAMCQWKA